MPTTKKARTTTRKRSTNSADAISLLKKDHEKVRGLLKRLESAADKGDGRAEGLLAQVDREVKIHSQVEEEIFYPAFKEAARTKEDNKLFFEATEEHHVVDLVMPEVHESEGGAEDFAAKTKVLKDLIEHHAEEEEKQMFPKAKKLMGREELQELGRRIKARKQELGAE
jgi:hemerythrin superfamily protein